MFKKMISAAGLICLIAGCSQNANDLGGKKSDQLTDKDNSFLTTVAVVNMTEIQTSQLALTNSQSDPVKKFASEMISDHQKATSQADAVGTGIGFASPTMLDSSHQDMVNDLKLKMGGDFDKTYIGDQVKAHEATIAAAEDEANNGSNQQVRNLATQLLPTLKMHLAMAQTLKSSMATAGGM